MKHLSILFSFVLLSGFVFSQQNKYWVTYTDKNASVFSIDNPHEFLSQKAIDRRELQNIAIVENDLPVPQLYIDVINDLGAEIINSSKWMNGSVLTASENQIAQIADLIFVEEVKLLSTPNIHQSTIDFSQKLAVNEISAPSLKTNANYGHGGNQIKMIGGDILHDMGHTGSGIEIAVMDNGFSTAFTSTYFADAINEGRLKIGYDYVDNDSTVDDGGNHGLNVLSTMLSNIEGSLVGTAPDATYYLFITEDNDAEGLQEEINWMMAAERVDTLLGTKAIITTSLGYSNGFNDPADNHTYADMDGNTTIITQAADIAASKGILVINSAGNEGNSDWNYITAPSDGDSVLCIGAVRFDATLAAFSSRGPSADGDVKPNVCAQGEEIAAINSNDEIVLINGTSFSCPILAGYAACLWQSMPTKTSMEIFQEIEASAHLFNNPNDDIGYGIPNLPQGWVSIVERSNPDTKNQIAIYPNPIVGHSKFEFTALESGHYEIQIINTLGQIVFQETSFYEKDANSTVVVPTENWNNGTYIFTISSDNNQGIYEIFMK